jgi:hypothetical protein
VGSKSQNESFLVWISTRDGSLSEAELIESVHQEKIAQKATYRLVSVIDDGGCVRPLYDRLSGVRTVFFFLDPFAVRMLSRPSVQLCKSSSGKASPSAPRGRRRAVPSVECAATGCLAGCGREFLGVVALGLATVCALSMPSASFPASSNNLFLLHAINCR